MLRTTEKELPASAERERYRLEHRARSTVHRAEALLLGRRPGVSQVDRPRAGRLERVGAADAAAPAIASGLGHAQATAMLERVHSGAIAAVEPLALLGDIGVALLGVAALKAGAPRWAAAAIAVGALGEGAGFATSTKALVITSFAILFVGLLPAVRTLRTNTRPHPAAEPAPAIAVS